MNLNVSHGAFHEALRLDKLVTMHKDEPDPKKSQLEGSVKGLRVKLLHLSGEMPRLATISGLAKPDDGLEKVRRLGNDLRRGRERSSYQKAQQDSNAGDEQSSDESSEDGNDQEAVNRSEMKPRPIVDFLGAGPKNVQFFLDISSSEHSKRPSGRSDDGFISVFDFFCTVRKSSASNQEESSR